MPRSAGSGPCSLKDNDKVHRPDEDELWTRLRWQARRARKGAQFGSAQCNGLVGGFHSTDTPMYSPDLTQETGPKLRRGAPGAIECVQRDVDGPANGRRHRVTVRALCDAHRACSGCAYRACHRSRCLRPGSDTTCAQGRAGADDQDRHSENARNAHVSHPRKNTASA